MIARAVPDDLQLALDASDLAAALAQSYFEAGVEPGRKADGSVVTEADRAVERLLRETLTTGAAGDAVLGEELGRLGTSSRVWILDPIDGTSAFAAGDVQWRVHVALEIAGRIDVAVVTAPAIGVQWWATRGAGAFESAWPRATGTGARRLTVSSTGTIADAVLDGLDECRPRLPLEATLTPFDRPTWCAGLMGLVRGEVDGFLGDGFEVWDHAPWTLLVEEAGGTFTDLDGARHSGAGGGLYTNGHLHQALLASLRAPAPDGDANEDGRPVEP